MSVSPSNIVIAGRPRDLEDAKGVILKNPSLDRSYIRQWLARFDQALAMNHLQAFRALEKKSAPRP